MTERGGERRDGKEEEEEGMERKRFLEGRHGEEK